MSEAPIVSVIICTRNRAAHLRETLRSLAQAQVPPDLPCELIVVDNGSTDDTALVVQNCVLPNMPVRLVREARGGKSAAYNAGLAAAQGQILLLTDDDVHPPADWVEGMARPIANGEADAVAGGVAIAPLLLRDWMTRTHRHWLASTEGLTGDARTTLVGANMAFAKSVRERVPGFDTELGGGAFGFAEDTLFSYQLASAGYRIVARPDVQAVHHFDPARLSRESFVAAARARGRSSAYMARHWHHWTYSAPRLRLLLNMARLAWVRECGRRTWHFGNEGLPEAELRQIVTVEMLRQYLTERRRPANYQASSVPGPSGLP